MIQKFVEIKSKKVGQASFIASTPNSDRYDDVIDQNSWILEGYKNNPVILLNHRQDMLPIGRATKIGVVNGQLEIDVEFDMEDELGKNVARKVDQGFLKAVSVGFQPRKGIMRSELPEEHKAFGKSGMFYSDNELLEVSVVTIPANSEAIAKNFSPLKEVIRQIVRSELLSKPTSKLEEAKEIIEIEESIDRLIVHFRKNKPMETTIKRELVGSMVSDGIEMPLYSTKEEAEEEAEKMGGTGSHEHTLDGKTVFMPFESHEQIMEIMGEKEEPEELEEAGYGHDDDEKEKIHYEEESEDEETNMKSLIKFLLS